MSNKIEVEVDYPAHGATGSASRVVRAAVHTILEREGFSTEKAASVSVLITDSERLRRLNREFASDDHATDVLSFAARTDVVYPGEHADADCISLGDIAISMEHAARQARVKGWRFEKELAMLAIHGTLHLLGYDHAEPDEERVMFGKTDAALARVLDD